MPHRVACGRGQRLETWNGHGGTGDRGAPGRGDLGIDPGLRGPEGVAVSIFDWIALGSALLLGVYLTVALLKPEYFE